MCAEEFRPQTVRVRTISTLTSGSKVLLAAGICTGDENILISHKRVEGKAWGRRGKPQERAELRTERGG